MADCSVASEIEDECLFEPFHYFKAAFGLLDRPTTGDKIEFSRRSILLVVVSTRICRSL